MSNKAGLNNGPHPQSQGAASPSRRRLLQGLGLGALALGGSRGAGGGQRGGAVGDAAG